MDVEKNAAEDTVVLKEGMTTIAPSRRWQELYGKRNKTKQVDHIMKSGSGGIIINWSNTCEFLVIQVFIILHFFSF